MINHLSSPGCNLEALGLKKRKKPRNGIYHIQEESSLYGQLVRTKYLVGLDG